MSSVSEWSAVEDGNTHLDQYDLEKQVNPHSPLNRYTKKIMAAVKASTDAMQAEIDTLAPMGGVVHLQGDETVYGVKTFNSPIVGSLSGDVAVAAAGTIAQRPLSARLADAINILDFGAVGDGSTPSAEAIQSALDAAHASGRAVLIPAGEYLIDSHLLFKSNTTVFGYGARLVRGYDVDAERYGSTAWLTHDSGETVCHDVNIFGLTFDNNAQNFHIAGQNIISIGTPVNSEKTFKNISFVDCVFENWVNQHALDVQKTSGLRVVRCTFRDVLYILETLPVNSQGLRDTYAWNRWEAIQLDSGGGLKDQDWVVEGCTFEATRSNESVTIPAGTQLLTKHDDSGQPVYYTLESDVTVSFVAPRTGIGQHSGPDYENTSYKNIKIIGNTFRDCGYAGVTLYGVSDSIVAENYFYDCYQGIELNTRCSIENGVLYRFPADNVRIENNVIEKPSTSQSYKTTAFAIKAMTNILEDAPSGFESEKVGAAGLVVSGNTISGYYYAVYSRGLYDSRISGNKVADCGGFFTGAGKNLTFSDNLLVNACQLGFDVAAWGYIPNRSSASANRLAFVVNNVFVVDSAVNWQINTANLDIVDISRNTIYDYGKTNYGGSYIYVSSGKTVAIRDNIVYAENARSGIMVSNGTSGAVSGNVWIVNGEVQS